MHILMLPSWYPEQAGDFHGSFFREQAEALVEVGNTVGMLAVATVSVSDPLARRSVGLRHARHALEGGVTVLRGVAVRPVPLAHGFNASSVAAQWERFFLRYVARHGRPDVLHAHAMNPAGIAAERISRRHGIPFIVTEHRPDSALSEFSSRRLASHLRRAATGAAALIAVSPGFAQALSDVYAPARWGSISNLLPRQFEDVELRPRETGPFVFGHVSNLHPYKGVPVLVEAFSRAFGNDPSVQLRIAGESVFRAELERDVVQRHLTNISFVGAVTRREITDEFARYDAFALSSEAESFGVVFWEALACGLPLVATSTDGGRYAVRPETGLLSAIDDPVDLALALQRMRMTAGSYDRELIRQISIDECGAAAFTERYAKVYRAAARQDNPCSE